MILAWVETVLQQFRFCLFSDQFKIIIFLMKACVQPHIASLGKYIGQKAESHKGYVKCFEKYN